MKNLVLLFLVYSAALNGQHSTFGPVYFTKADSIALYYKNASLKNLPVLTHNLTHSLETDVEKFRAIYTWICTNIENDYSSYLKTTKKRKKLFKNPEALAEWNSSFTPKVFEKLRKQKKTACTGYAYLLREMATLADITCVIVNGYGRTPTLILDKNSIPNHSWNAVKLDDKWYLCDPTWSAGKIYIDENGPQFKAEYFDSYFLADPALFIKNHYPLEAAWTLLEHAPTFEVFKNGPVLYREAFKKNILATQPKEMHLEVSKNDTLAFKFTSKNSIAKKQISLVLNTTNSSKTVSPKITTHENEYILNYVFDKKGYFDVHLVVDEAILYTYVVKVKRN